MSERHRWYDVRFQLGDGTTIVERAQANTRRMAERRAWHKALRVPGRVVCYTLSITHVPNAVADPPP